MCLTLTCDRRRPDFSMPRAVSKGRLKERDKALLAHIVDVHIESRGSGHEHESESC